MIIMLHNDGVIVSLITPLLCARYQYCIRWCNSWIPVIFSFHQTSSSYLFFALANGHRCFYSVYMGLGQPMGQHDLGCLT